jgi:two-component system, cell cycle response regulator DivK
VKKILVVEDNPLNRQLLVRHLARRPDWSVATADDGSEGLDKALLEERPDLILMDLDLPILDGWTLTRAIKSYSQTADIPIIAVTAHTSRKDRARAIAAGCRDVVTKPIDPVALLQAIDSALA